MTYHEAMNAPLHTSNGGSQVEDGEDTPLHTQEKCCSWFAIAFAAALAFAGIAFAAALGLINLKEFFL